LPPGRGGRAPQASRHNKMFEAGLTDKGTVAAGAGGWLATTLGAALGAGAALGEGGELGSAVGLFEQAPAAVIPAAIPARRSNRRRLSSGSPERRGHEDASIRVTIRIGTIAGG
jgi:hypothetical protein